MSKVRNLICIIAIGIVTTGCASYKIPVENLSTSRISNAVVIKQKEILVNKNYKDIERVEFVVYRTRVNIDHHKYRNFMETMLGKIGFKKIISESEFAKLIIDKGIDEKIGATYDLISLHKIYKELGPFLVITTSLNHVGNTLYDNQAIIVDPESAEILLQMHMKSTYWADLDREFNYPVINLINDWYKASM